MEAPIRAWRQSLGKEIDIGGDFSLLVLREPLHYQRIVSEDKIAGTVTYDDLILTDYMFIHRCRDKIWACYPKNQLVHECCGCHKVLQVTEEQLNRYKGLAAIVL
jgi:hypothetical protein